MQRLLIQPSSLPFCIFCEELYGYFHTMWGWGQIGEVVAK